MYILFILLWASAQLFCMDQVVTYKTPVIPKKLFFASPTKSMPSISSDGTKIAYLAPLAENSALNIWVKSIDKNDDSPLTNLKRSIKGHFWAGDQIIFLHDSDGTENWRLYGVNIHTKEIDSYTPYENVQTRIISRLDTDLTKIIIAFNKEDAKIHDVYSLDLLTKSLHLIYKNELNIVHWAVDCQGNVRAGLSYLDDGTKKLYVRDDNKSPWRLLHTYTFEESANNASELVGFLYKQNAALMLDTHGYYTNRLIAYDTQTGQRTVLASDKEYDVATISANPTTGESMLPCYQDPDTEEVEAIMTDRERPVWQVLKRGLCEEVLETFRRYGNVHILGHDRKRRYWIVEAEADTSPYTYYLYDTEKRVITELFKTRPDLPSALLAPMEPLSFKSSDGRFTIHGYITFPQGSSRKNMPLVLFVHGGPWMRDSWGYDGRVQLLANRGYVVLQINFRGSAGYGKEFTAAANKEWGGKIHDDLVDGINYVIKEGIADPKRIAIFGISFGGFAALTGVTKTPDLFCCAIDCVGQSNLVTFIRSIPPYWKPFLQKFIKGVGNPETEFDFLMMRSPISHVDAIRVPLLISHGAQDQRVKRDESEMIVHALKEKGIPHEYLLFPDEGHGFSRPENRIKFYDAVERFLSKHLGGRCELIEEA